MMTGYIHTFIQIKTVGIKTPHAGIKMQLLAAVFLGMLKQPVK
jgi:hypothetical protein